MKCLEKLARPYCPLCKENITDFLIANGISHKEIQEKIELDDERVIYETMITLNFKDMPISAQESIACLAIKVTKEWYKIYHEIIMDKITNIGHILYDISETYRSKNQIGIFMINFSIHSLISAFIGNNEIHLLQWKTNHEIHLDNVYSEEKNNLLDQVKQNKDCYGVLISLGSDRRGRLNETYVKGCLVHKNITNHYPAHMNICTSICKMEIYDKNNIDEYVDVNEVGYEYVWAMNKLKLLQSNIKHDLLLYEKAYDCISEMMKKEFEPLLTFFMMAFVVFYVGNEDRYDITRMNNQIRYLTVKKKKKNKRGGAEIIGTHISNKLNYCMCILLNIDGVLHRYYAKKNDGKLYCMKLDNDVFDTQKYIFSEEGCLNQYKSHALDCRKIDDSNDSNNSDD